MGPIIKAVDNGRQVKTEKLVELKNVGLNNKQVVNQEAAAALIKQLTEKVTVEKIEKYLDKETNFVSDVAAGRQKLTFDDIERLEEATDLPVSAMFASCLTTEGLPPEKKSVFEDVRSAMVKFLKSAAEWGSFARKNA